MNTTTRRTFAQAASALLGSSLMPTASPGQATTSDYKRADAHWFADCPFGVSTHWTALSQAVHPADWRPFPQTVAKFDVERFADRIATTGASYLIFTTCHALQWLAGPCDAIERVLPGRTNKRDMVGELARALRQRNIHLILYYNHSCNHGDDPAWEYAVGYHESDRSRLVSNLLPILRELGQRHGELAKAWWFDSCFALDTHGPKWGKSTVPDAYRFPWNDWVAAAKAGSPERLVSLSPGMMRYYLYTDHQDYEWGEANDLVAVPAAQFTPDGLQAHRWVCLDNREWVHGGYNEPLTPSRFDLQHLLTYVRTAHRFRVPVTFNIDVDRNGEFLPETLELLGQVRKQLA
jgi:Alpha-L-fucosidase